MATQTHEQPLADPFGDEVGERLWRRLAGAGLAATLVAAGVMLLWGPETLPFVLLGVLVVYLLGVPASWVAGRTGRAVMRRHLVAGAAVGVLVPTLLSMLGGDWGWWLLYAIFSIGIGVPLAALAAWLGLALPGRLVRPVAIGALLVTVVVLPLGTWLVQRPPAPYDFVVVHEPAEVARRVPDPHALAHVIAERLEQQVAQGAPPLAHQTWQGIDEELGARELAGAATWMRHLWDDELPRLRATGEPVRLVTTIFDDDPARGCVVVTASTTLVEPHACAELDLTR